MNKEQLIATLQACYFGDKGAYNKMLKESEQLQTNWNELKQYLTKEQARIVIENTNEDEFVYTDLLNKMAELERGEE